VKLKKDNVRGKKMCCKTKGKEKKKKTIKANK